MNWNEVNGEGMNDIYIYLYIYINDGNGNRIIFNQNDNAHGTKESEKVYFKN